MDDATNPYAPPESQGEAAAEPQDSSPENQPLPVQLALVAQYSRPWMRFLSIIGLIVAGLAMLGALTITVVALATGDSEMVPMAGLSLLFYGGMAVLSAVPSIALFRYASSIDGLTGSGAGAAAARMFSRQHSFWRMAGLTCIALIVLYALMVAAMFVFVIAGFAAGG